MAGGGGPQNQESIDEWQIFYTISWGGQKGEIEKRKEGRRIYLFIGPAAGLLDPHLPYIYLDICLYTKHA